MRRVVTLWQSGEAFEQAGGKRERGLIFLGAARHRQDDAREGDRDGVQLAVRLDPGLRLRRDVHRHRRDRRPLSSRGRRSGWRASGAARASSSSTRSTPSACAGRRSTRASPGRPASARRRSTTTSSSARTAPSTSSGDLILETRAWRERLFAERAPQSLAPSGLQMRLNSAVELHVPGHGRAGRARAQPAARRHGRDRQPAVHAARADEQAQHVPRRDLHRAAPDRPHDAAPAGAAPALASRSTSSARPTCRSTGSTRH